MANRSKKKLVRWAWAVSSNMSYPQVLWEEFIVIHCRKTRDFNEFSFCMVKYLFHTVSVTPSSCIIRKYTHLRTNFISGQPSSSSLFIYSCTEISYTTYRFWTKKTNNGRGPGCYKRDYWDRMFADRSSSKYLRKVKKLELET